MAGRPDGPIRFVLADDDERFRHLVRASLSDEYELVGEARNAEEAIAVVRALTDTGMGPDVAVLDYVMPGRDGIDAARELREFDPGLPIVVFSSLFDRTLTLQVEALGLHYVEKAGGVDALEFAMQAAVVLREPAASVAAAGRGRHNGGGGRAAGPTTPRPGQDDPPAIDLR
jgi:DNA-binding NarL/FixJ family response regulator